jgi:16S rRNA (guanine527-N7)-methyltransferase
MTCITNGCTDIRMYVRQPSHHLSHPFLIIIMSINGTHPPQHNTYLHCNTTASCDTTMKLKDSTRRNILDPSWTVKMTVIIVLHFVGACCCWLTVQGFQEGYIKSNHHLNHPSHNYISHSNLLSGSSSCLKVYKDMTSSSSSSNFAMDPNSDTARRIIRDTLQLSSEQHQQLTELAILVNDWNSNINLISRKDCSPEVIFGRHILPSLAPLAILSSNSTSPFHHETLRLMPGQLVCDVGTGGGFPGLPLAIARPDVHFWLVDSVGKKTHVVEDMATQLGLKNVKTIHGRAESLSTSSSMHEKQFDWVVGRSVAAIPTFAFWIDRLLKSKEKSRNSGDGDNNNGGDCGHLVYLIGGDIEESILDYVAQDKEIATLLNCPIVSDKRVLIFSQPSVHQLALASGEKLRSPTGSRGSNIGGRPVNNIGQRQNNVVKTKGQWKIRDTTVPKQRGYEGFRRFDSAKSE